MISRVPIPFYQMDPWVDDSLLYRFQVGEENDVARVRLLFSNDDYKRSFSWHLPTHESELFKDTNAIRHNQKEEEEPLF